MQPVVPRKKRGISDYMTWAMIGFGVVLVICLTAWAVIAFMGKTSSDTGKTQAGVAAVLEPESVAPSVRTIKSQLGVQVSYNIRELEGFGFADEVTFSNTDLDESRIYTVIRVRPLETSEATRSNVALQSPELRVTSSISQAYWDNLSAKKDYKDLSKIDMLVKETVTSREQDKAIEASDTEVVNINDIDYRKVTFTATNDRYGVTTERREDCYMTVQNDRPYVACINGVRNANFAVLPQLEQVLAEIKYDGLDEDALEDAASDTSKQDAAMLDAEQDEEVSGASSADDVDAVREEEDAVRPEEESREQSGQAEGSKVSSYISDTANFKAMATAAPATVRVGTVYCADIKLTLPTTGGDGPTLTGACSEKAGTGFIVSRDGLVATSASSVQVKPQEAITAYITDAPSSEQAMQRLQRVLDYMVEGRIIMQTDADAIVAGVEERDQEIIAKVNELGYRIAIEDIAVTKESYKYAVQLADKPIVVNRQGDGSASFAYTDTVVEAEEEGRVYATGKTQDQIYKGESVASDTALMKLKDSATYPVLTLAHSGEGVADKSTVNIVGMPMYAVGSLEAAQFRGTPMYRGGKVVQTFTADAGQKVYMVDASSHAGLAGAPALDQHARVVGMATYGNLNCQDRKCFASTVIRDNSGISEIAKQRNIALQTSSPSSDAWKDGLEQLTRGNYREATGLFEQAARLYPQNQFATQFAAYSKSQYGSATDTSTMNMVVGVLQVVSLLAFGMLLILTIMKVALKMFIKPHIETQYGQMAHGQYIDPSQWQQQVVTPAPQQTAAPLTQMPQPAQWQDSSSSPQPSFGYSNAPVPQSQDIPIHPQQPVSQTQPTAPSQQADVQPQLSVNQPQASSEESQPPQYPQQ